VSAAGETSLTLCALGAVPRGKALTRRGARAGDRICVTGTLGASALEVALAARGLAKIRRVPEPRLEAGRVLARLAGVGGCIDVSDGLEADLEHLLEGTDLLPELDLGRVPRPPRFAAACARGGLDPDRLVLGGGEDYELLFSVRPSAPPAGQLGRRLGVAVAEIGRLVRRPGRSRRGRAGGRGWRHF
jgi:thiamine-monophosphate kinase